MLFKHFYEPDLAQGSYLIGCQQSGEAIVIDARRDIQVYIEEAASQAMTIIAVSETHIHADYLSGSRELAQATGATLYLSDEGDADWKYGFAGVKLCDGDEIKLGNIIIQALHSPGHTPEHLSFLVTDGATTDRPGFILSGDFVFVGDVGRPDLLDEAAGAVDSRFPAAKQLFASLKEVFLNLPDYVQVWPGHGAGSACGKALGAIASSTVGYERLFSWWAAYVLADDEAGFVEALLEGQPDAPRYFARMKQHNKNGPALIGESKALIEWSAASLKGRVNRDIILIDSRSANDYHQDAVLGSINIPFNKSFATYAAYVIDPDRDDRDIVVLASDEPQAEAMRARLSYVGIDRVSGYISSVVGLERAPVGSIAAADLARLDQPYLLDIRTANEYQAGHLPEARQLHAGQVMWQQDSLPKTQTIVTYCQSGARNTVVSSALRAAGFDNLLELEGSYLAWQETQQSLAEV